MSDYRDVTRSGLCRRRSNAIGLARYASLGTTNQSSSGREGTMTSFFPEHKRHKIASLKKKEIIVYSHGLILDQRIYARVFVRLNNVK